MIDSTKALRLAGPVLIVLLGFLLIVLLHEINSTQGSLRKAVHRNHELALAIQHSRYESALTNCRDQNMRHDAAVAYLVKLTKQQKLTQEGLKEFETFIGALAPHVADCAKKARLVVSRS